MNSFKYIVFLILSFPLINCVHTTTTSPFSRIFTFKSFVNTDGLKVHYVDGHKTFESKKRKSIVSCGFSKDFIMDQSENKNTEKMYLFVKFKNLSSKPIIVSNKNISVILQSNNKPLKILEYYELESEIHTATNRQTYIDYSLLHRELEELKKVGILKKNTVQPNHSVEGIVAVEMANLIQKQDENYTINVNFAGDIHQFYVLREPFKKVKEETEYRKNKRPFLPIEEVFSDSLKSEMKRNDKEVMRN